ncbi:MAG: hypothetical protein ACP5LA_07260 [Thermoplasmata archaeon]
MEDDENDKIVNLESENSNNILEKYFNISYSDQYDQYVHYFCLLNKDTGILKSIKKERENLGHDGYTGQQQSSTSNLNIESSTETLIEATPNASESLKNVVMDKDAPQPEIVQQNAKECKETQTCEVCGKETNNLYEYNGLHVCIDCLNAKQHQNDDIYEPK